MTSSKKARALFAQACRLLLNRDGSRLRLRFAELLYFRFQSADFALQLELAHGSERGDAHAAEQRAAENDENKRNRSLPQPKN